MHQIGLSATFLRGSSPDLRIDVAIDGVPLQDLVRAIELPNVRTESSKLSLAGSYAGVDLVELYLPPLKQSVNHLGGGLSNPTLMLMCTCGERGCWPLLTELVLTDEVVAWTGFQNPHRSAWRKERVPQTPVWRYDGLGPFTFDRQQYQAEVTRMRRELERSGWVDGL